MGVYKLFNGLRTYIFPDRDIEVAGKDELTSDWMSGQSVRVGTLKIHDINGTTYLFQNLVPDNIDEPSLNSESWRVIGIQSGGVDDFVTVTQLNAAIIAINNNISDISNTIQISQTFTYDDFESDGISITNDLIGEIISVDLRGTGPLKKTTDAIIGEFTELLPGLKITIDGFIADDNTILTVTFKKQQ